MSALARIFEAEGLQTTGISLVRENTVAMRPPRFLWTSFPLGRPLGVPGDAAFQRRVILAALDLLRRPAGPVLEDYPEDAPPLAVEAAASCPVSFARAPVVDGRWATRLVAEMRQLAPWYDLSRSRRGRTTVGLAKLPVQDCAARLAAVLEAGSVAGMDLGAMKYATEDLKAWYREAMTAQPGRYDAAAIERMLWHETELGQAIRALAALMAADPLLRTRRAGFLPRIAEQP